MTVVVPLDAGPLGLVTNPRGSPETMACNQWMYSLVERGVRICVPEIADYEIRRELLRADKLPGIARLDALKGTITYLPVTTEVMLRAAELWAMARKRGRPTAPDAALDCDVILGAQAQFAGREGDEVVIATTNTSHLTLFAAARRWQDIR